MNQQPILVPFVERQDLTDQCIALINEEWPKSETVRRMSLEKSANNDPPMAFVLMSADKEDLLGYARFLHVFNYNDNAALFDTVVIRKSLRGQGLGKLLMDLLKEEAKCRGYKLLVLCTVDKEAFYEKCGYTRCKFLNLITHKLNATSEKLATSMNFNRPIPLNEIDKFDLPVSSPTSTSSVPLPPPPLNKLAGYKEEKYLFCYI
ncbi:N-acetyltransferase domain-containing protein [Aphelenchoides bicaudatus]|nr:N-acetyltransferase domain-containing protein [Aphelenchoides bicaudatus]